MHLEMGFLCMWLCLSKYLCRREKDVRGRKRHYEGQRECMAEKGMRVTSLSLGSWTLGTDLVRQTLRGVSSLEGIIHLNPGRMAVIDAQTGAALNNLYHAG